MRLIASGGRPAQCWEAVLDRALGRGRAVSAAFANALAYMD